MDSDRTFPLPFGPTAELELQTEWGTLNMVPVERGGQPRLELHRGSSENINIDVQQHGDAVRVRLEPQRNFNWFGGWECRVTLFVPTDIRAHIQTNAGSVHVRDLDGCELGIKANAGKIDLVNVHGLLHLAADAGSITGRDIGGLLNIETQAGSVRLEVTELQPGDHHIRATMGEIKLQLARGMDVCVETHSSLGSIRNSYPSRQSAPVRLRLSTDVGSVRVDEVGFSMPPRPPRPHQPHQPPHPPRPERPMPPVRPGGPPEPDPELDRILKMVEAGELSAKEADELLQAMGKA